MDTMLDYLDGEHKEYQVWYITNNRKLSKRKGFKTLTEAKRWCNNNKNKVKVTSGSWQVLEMFGL